MQNEKESGPAHQDLRPLRAAVHLAQEMGAGLAAGEILFQALRGRGPAQTRSRRRRRSRSTVSGKHIRRRVVQDRMPPGERVDIRIVAAADHPRHRHAGL